MTEAQVQAAIGPLDDVDPADLAPAVVAALRLADALTETGIPTLDPDLRAELGRHYSDGQILELGAALTVASGWQRMIELFQIRPDHWSEATPAPVRPPSGPGPARHDHDHGPDDPPR
jgi:alkylhydroperoxidase family enzyme